MWYLLYGDELRLGDKVCLLGARDATFEATIVDIDRTNPDHDNVYVVEHIDGRKPHIEHVINVMVVADSMILVERN